MMTMAEKHKILCWILEEEILLVVADSLATPALIQQIPHNALRVLKEGEEYQKKRRERRATRENLEQIVHDIQQLCGKHRGSE